MLQEAFDKYQGKYSDITWLGKEGWFTIGVDNESMLEYPPERQEKMIRLIKSNALTFAEEATKKLSKLGFSKQHSYVIVSIIKEENDIEGGASGGLAYNHYIVLELRDVVRPRSFEATIGILVHEWAHRWMKQASKNTKRHILAMFQNIIRKSQNKLRKHPLQSFQDYHFDSYSTNLSQNIAKFYKILQQQLRNNPGDVYNSVKVALFSLVPQSKKDIDSKFDSHADLYIREISEEIESQLSLSDDNGFGLTQNMSTQVGRFVKTVQEYAKSRKAYRANIGELDTPDAADIRNKLAQIAKWPSSYGLATVEELWATAIEYYDQLDRDYRKMVNDIISQIG